MLLECFIMEVQEHDSLSGLLGLSQLLQHLLSPEISLAELLKQEEICLRPSEAEDAMQQLDKANVKVANALQRLIQVSSAPCLNALIDDVIT